MQGNVSIRMSHCETRLYFTLFLCFKEGRRQSSPLHAPPAAACGVEYLLDLQPVPKSRSHVLAGCWKSALDAHQTTLLPCPGTCRSICAHTRTNPRHHSQIIATETDSEGPEKPAVHPGPTAGFAASAAEYRRRPRSCSVAFRGVRGDAEVYSREKQVRKRRANAVLSHTYVCGSRRMALMNLFAGQE